MNEPMDARAARRALILRRVAEIRRVLAARSERFGQPPKLIAVTKTVDADDINLLRDAGVTDIAENRAQAIVEKSPRIDPFFQIHCIGRLQSNKVKYIIDRVCLFHALDRLTLAQEIDRLAVKRGRRLPVLVQVNIAQEPQKAGLPTESVRPFLRDIAGMDGLSVRGLMAIMPNTGDEEALTAYFRGMRTLFEQLQQEALSGIEMRELSMGMSHDYALAAQEGATMVRIGSAIFAPEEPSADAARDPMAQPQA